MSGAKSAAALFFSPRTQEMLVAQAVSEALTGSFGARRLARLGTFVVGPFA